MNIKGQIAVLRDILSYEDLIDFRSALKSSIAHWQSEGDEEKISSSRDLFAKVDAVISERGGY